jgi:hypothetical protein
MNPWKHYNALSSATLAPGQTQTYGLHFLLVLMQDTEDTLLKTSNYATHLGIYYLSHLTCTCEALELSPPCN